MGLKPRPPAPKPRIASHDWGDENRIPRSQGGTRKHSPTSHTWSGDCNNSNHHSAKKHKSKAPHLTRGHKTQPLSSPPQSPNVTQSRALSTATLSHPGRDAICLALMDTELPGLFPRPLCALYPFPPRSLSILSCPAPHFHSISALPTGHLSSHLLPSPPGVGGRVHSHGTLKSCSVRRGQ